MTSKTQMWGVAVVGSLLLAGNLAAVEVQFSRGSSPQHLPPPIGSSAIRAPRSGRMPSAGTDSPRRRGYRTAAMAMRARTSTAPQANVPCWLVREMYKTKLSIHPKA